MVTIATPVSASQPAALHSNAPSGRFGAAVSDVPVVAVDRMATAPVRSEGQSVEMSTAKKGALVSRVMQQSDDLVIVFDYTGGDGAQSRRVVSPIRFLGGDRFLGLCLSSEEPRQFYLSRSRNIRVDLALRYVMPVAMEEIPA